jgi:DNA-binding GntR family transcriptional regulator
MVYGASCTIGCVADDLAAALGQFREQPRRTAHQSVVAALRQAILSGSIPGGTRLVQADLARHFGVSNTPVREALRQLATEGLVRFDSYRGAVVESPTAEDVEEVYELLLVLESLAVRKAVERITDDELAQLHSLHEQMQATDDVSDWVQLNRQFHTVLHEAAGSPRLVTILNGLRDASTSQVAMAINSGLVKLERSNAEHARIVSAVGRRNADRAAEQMTKHLNSTLNSVRAQAGSAAA